MTTLSPSKTFTPVQETLLEPGRSGRVLNLRELFQYRDLLWYLALRDIQVRYKQTVLGASWAVIRPVMMMIVFTAVFGKMLKIDAESSAPYPIFVYAGLLPWTFVSTGVNSASLSLLSNADMVRKIYFPRLILPLSSLGAPLVDLLIAFIVLVLLMIWYSLGFGLSLLLLPAALLSTILATTGVGVFLAALIVRYRDLRHVIPFMLQIWLFLTPVIYPLSIDRPWAWMLNLNPVSGPILACRAAVLGEPIDYFAWGLSTAVGIAVLILGLLTFSRTESEFADVI